MKSGRPCNLSQNFTFWISFPLFSLLLPQMATAIFQSWHCLRNRFPKKALAPLPLQSRRTSNYLIPKSTTNNCTSNSSAIVQILCHLRALRRKWGNGSAVDSQIDVKSYWWAGRYVEAHKGFGAEHLHRIGGCGVTSTKLAALPGHYEGDKDWSCDQQYEAFATPWCINEVREERFEKSVGSLLLLWSLGSSCNFLCWWSCGWWKMT